MKTIYNNTEYFINNYITSDGKYYFTGDIGLITEQNYLGILGRFDDMIKTGNTMMTTASTLKKNGARDIYYLAPFGLFTNGFEEFDKAYEEGLIKAVVCTNLIYRPQELLDKPWYVDVNMIPFVARIIDALNVDESIGNLNKSTTRITDFLSQVRLDEFIDDKIN